MGQNNRLKRSSILIRLAVIKGSIMPTEDRMPPIAAERLTAEQRKAAEEFAAGRGYRAVRSDAALAGGHATRQGHGRLLTFS
jgi:hypothetical protein